MDVLIRKGRESDLARLRELIVELAVFENEPDAVRVSLESMKTDGFGPQSIFEFLVAELNGNIVGAAVYYYRYSTWKGKRLYLEDLIVSSEHRRKGIGKKLFEQTMMVAKSTACTGLMWQVLDWNESAIAFYKTYHAAFDDQWLNCNVDF